MLLISVTWYSLHSLRVLFQNYHLLNWVPLFCKIMNIYMYGRWICSQEVLTKGWCSSQNFVKAKFFKDALLFFSQFGLTAEHSWYEHIILSVLSCVFKKENRLKNIVSCTFKRKLKTSFYKINLYHLDCRIVFLVSLDCKLFLACNFEGFVYRFIFYLLAIFFLWRVWTYFYRCVLRILILS